MRVCLEGNIGAGKSTVLDLLARHYTIVPEPVDEWELLLDGFYTAPADWGFALNLAVLVSFKKAYDAAPATNVIFERSPRANRHVFGQLMYNDGHLTPRAWDLFKGYSDDLGWDPDVYVYLDTPVDLCYQRIHERGRPSEATLQKEYVSRIEFQYENMLRFTTVPVIRVDGTQDPAAVADTIINYLSQQK